MIHQIFFSIIASVALFVHTYFDFRVQKTIPIIDIAMFLSVIVLISVTSSPFVWWALTLFLIIFPLSSSFVLREKVMGLGDVYALAWILPGLFFLFPVITTIAFFFITGSLLLISTVFFKRQILPAMPIITTGFLLSIFGTALFLIWF